MGITKLPKSTQLVEQLVLTSKDAAQALREIIPKEIRKSDIHFLCVGTDASTGDSLGPLVGTFLANKGYKNVIGTLEDPCHAKNYTEKIKLLPKNKKIIVIDSCLGWAADIKKINISNQPLKPGSAVNRKLAPIGHYSIKGVVNVGGYFENLVLQNTRLHIVYEMATEITEAIVKRFPISNPYSLTNNY